MKFILNKDTLKIENEDRINAGAVNYYEADIEYDESWKGLTIECVIVKKNNDVGNSIAVINKKIFIDQNLNGLYSIGFVGYTIEDNKKTYQVSTNLKTIHFYKGAGEIKTEYVDLPTPTEWEVYIAQIQEMIDNIEISGGTGGILEEKDPTVPQHVKNITEEDIEKWNNGTSSTNYNDLENKPKINNIELSENKTLEELGIQAKGNYATENFVANKIAEAELSGSDVDLSGLATKDELNAKVDKVTGKSLIDDAEIERLANVDNYDDTELRNQVSSKASIEDMTIYIEEHKEELKGDTGAQGEPGKDGQNGKDGVNGQDGTDGKSAYQIWLEEGNTGTEQDFLNSLIGKDGIDGVNGSNGIDGSNGEDGYSPTATVTQTETGAIITITDKNGTTTTNITNGKDGAKGEQGIQGEKGDKGDTGATGSQGPKGDTGEKGEQGAKGDTGPAGKDGANGVGISSVTQTTTSTADGGTNVITVTKTDGTTSTFSVKNGSKGSTGATGAQGEKGEKGETGEKGDAYTLTDNDKQEIANLVETGSIPDYWTEYLNTKVSTIKQLQIKGGKDCFSFIVITDMHYTQNLGKISPLLAKKICNECSIKYVLNLGDVMNRGAWSTKEQAQEEFIAIEKMLKPIRSIMLQTQGNHDGSYGSTLNDVTYPYNFSRNEIYEEIYRKVSSIDNIHFDTTGTAYYVDDKANKVRYIMLNSLCNPTETNADGSSKYNNMKRFRFTQSQYDFMESEALSIGLTDEWYVIVASHVPISNTYQTAFGAEEAGGVGDHVMMRNFLKAYKNKSTYSGSYSGAGEGDTPYDAVTIDVDFTSAKGNLLGYFSGHAHADYNYDVANWTIPIITTRCDGANENNSTLLAERVKGGITEQSFDVFTINKATKKMYVTKIGAGTDRIINFDGTLSDSDTTTYTITNNLDNVTNSNLLSSINEGVAYTGTLTPKTGYELSSVIITMGGTDITSITYSDGNISISNVTGDIVVTATAIATSTEPTNMIPLATVSATSTEIYEGVGYKDGAYLSGSTNNVGIGSDANFTLSGYIPYVVPSSGLPATIYIKGVTVDTSLSHTRMSMIREDGEYYCVNSTISTLWNIETLTDSNGETYYKFTPIAYNDTSKLRYSIGTVTHIRMCMKGTGANWVLTIDEDLA